MLHRTLSQIVFTLFSLALATHAVAADVSFSSLIDEMTRRDSVAKLPAIAYTLRQQSSYDRASVAPDQDGWFANKDWSNYIREEVNDGRKEFVMFEADGPGAIVRIWFFCTPYVGNIRFYIDGNTTPVIDGAIDSVIGGDALVGAPLSAVCAMGQNLYLPIPYAKSCKVTVDAPPPNLTEGNDRLVYYNFNYRTYADGTTVESFDTETLAKSPLRHPRVLGGGLEKTAQADAIAEFAQANHTALALDSRRVRGNDETWRGQIPPGESRVAVSHADRAEVREISLKVTAKDLAQALRSTLISISFDGKRTVYCPIGDFFGSGVGVNPHESRYTRIDPDGTLTAYWVMPFDKNFEMSFHNEGTQDVYITHVVVATWGRRDTAPPLYFHATWRQTRGIPTRPVTDWNAVTIEGRGVYVGDVLSLVNYHPFWWGEGDEKIYVDGEKFPSHFGTGTEDYYGYAWSSTDFFAHPFIGQPRSEGPAHPTQPPRNLQCFGNNTNYRYRALDAIPFNKSLKFDIEVYHHASAKVDYAMTTFWYGDAECKIVNAPSDETLIAEAKQPVHYNTPSQIRRPEIVETQKQTQEWRDEKRIIDLHQHVSFTEEHLKRDIAIMDRVGVGVVVNLSGDTVTHADGEKSAFERNKTLADSLFPGRFLHFFSLNFTGWDDEDWSARAVAQVDEAHRLGAAGLKEYKRLGLFYKNKAGELIKIDDPKLDPVWKRCGELGMPITIHVADPLAFWKPYDETNERWDELRDHPSWWFGDAKKYPPFESLLDALNRVIKKHPQTTFVCAHCGNNAEDLDWVARSLDAAPNMMIDIAARIPEIGRHEPEKVREFFTKYADRILFGTDFMVYDRLILGSSGNEPPPTDDDAVAFYEKHWQWFDTSDRNFPHMTPIQGNWTISAIQLPADVQRKILFDNARKLLAPFLPLPQVTAKHTDATITLDGVLDEPAWQSATPIFVESSLVTADVVPSVSTMVRVLAGADAFYVAFDAPFTELTIFEPVQDAERLGLWDRDVVEVFLGRADDVITKYTEFEIAPTNEKLDVVLDLPAKDFPWRSGFESAVVIDQDKKRWTTEVRIPYSSVDARITTRPAAGTVWRANFYRHDRASNTFTAWSPALAPSAHTPERFGTIVFVAE